MRRRSIINKLEEKNKVPEKLCPQKIKDMLDELGMVKPLIEGERKSEIRLNSNRGGFLKSLAIAAVFVLVIGGLAVIKFGKDSNSITTHPTSPLPQTADTDGLTGLRGGSYQALYNYLSDCEDTDDAYSSVAIDNLYAYSEDGSDTYTDKEISEMFRDSFDRLNQANGLSVCDDGTSADLADAALDGALVLQNDTSAFSAGYTDIYAYKLQGEETIRVDYDFWSQTYLFSTLASEPLLEKYSHTLKAYIVRTYLVDDRLIVTFDFHLPKSCDGHTVMMEYCGLCIYDVSDIDNISLLYEYEQPGYLASARLTQDGTFAILSDYSCAKRAADYLGYDDESLDFLPMIYENGEQTPIAEDSIYIANKSQSGRLVLLSSLSVGEAVEKIGQLTLTGDANSYAMTDSEVILSESYGMNDLESNQTDTHIIKLTFTDEVKASAAVYTSELEQEQTHFFYQMLSFDSWGGYYYIFNDMYEIIVLDEKLEFVNALCYSYDFQGSELSDEGELFVEFSNGKAYIGETLYTDDEICETCRCTEVIDLTDPKNPIHAIIENQEDAPIVYSSVYCVIDEGAAVSWASTYEYYEDESVLSQQLLKIYSLDIADKAVKQGHMPQYYDEYNEIYQGGEEFTAAALGELSSTESFDDCQEVIFGSFGYGEGESVSFCDSENNMIYLPVYKSEATEIECDEDYSETDMVVEYYDGDSVVSFITQTKWSMWIYAVEYDPDSYEMTVLGQTPAVEITCNGSLPYPPEYTGTIYLNGKLYVFTDIGMRCTSLKDMSKLLYNNLY